MLNDLLFKAETADILSFLAASEAEAVQGWAMPQLRAGAGSMLHSCFVLLSSAATAVLRRRKPQCLPYDPVDFFCSPIYSSFQIRDTPCRQAPQISRCTPWLHYTRSTPSTSTSRQGDAYSRLSPRQPHILGVKLLQ